MKRFYLRTFGCKVNQYEGQQIAEALQREHLEAVETPAEADLCIVNTCGVTAAGEAKGWRLAASLARAYPRARVILAGCAAKTANGRRTANGFAVAHDRQELYRIIGLHGQDTIEAFAGHSRAFVKVQDGCTVGCAYCILPHIRGPLWSKPLAQAVAEVRHLAHAGYGEVVLAGIHLGFYGRDLHDDTALDDLVERLLALPELTRLRLSSIEIMEVSDRLLDMMAATHRLAPHLHVPLQSGDDGVLRAMGRPYRLAHYLERVERIVNRLPDAALSTDIIVGFPGETEDQFLGTLAVLRRAGFSRVHVFPFSVRPGTAAAGLPGKLDSLTIKRRKETALQLAADLARRYRERLVGTAEWVLVQSAPAREQARGLGGRYQMVNFESAAPVETGQLVPVQIDQATPDGLRGHMLPAKAL